MTTEIRWRRGTAAQHASFTGALGEVTFDTTNKRLVLHDGVTAGGFPTPVLTGGTLAIASGGTGAASAATARTNLGAAASGANSDITSLSALSTAIAVAYGGTGTTNAAGARANLGAAGLGANNDITSLTALTTPLSIAQGGRGVNSLPVVDASLTTTLAASNGAFTKVVCTTEAQDSAGIHDTSTGRITPNVAGWYLFIANASSGGAAVTNGLLSTFYKNGVRHRDLGNAPLGNSGATALVFCNGSTDYVEFYVYQASGASINITAGTSFTYFQTFFVRS